MATDIYLPEVWGGFFQLVGSGAAALTGLVFVSMSLNLDVIIQDANHRYRAICTLTGLTSVFMICAFAIMGGQNHLAVGAEWAMVASIAAIIYVTGYSRARRAGRSSVGLSFRRLTVGVACYLVQVIGAIVLVSGQTAGLYVASVAMVVNVAFFISGAWLLMVGVQLDMARQKRNPQTD
ncbi:MAG: hypothetical protein ABR950_07170 [Candidatus Dormibacteria bacterium]|jgi:modulator of FtsH protease